MEGGRCSSSTPSVTVPASTRSFGTAARPRRSGGIIAEAYKQALGAPKFLWPDFYDRLTYDANDAREFSGTDAANATMQQLESALSQPEGSPIFKGFREAFRKFLKGVK